MPSLQANQLYHHRMRTVSGDRPGILNLQLLLFEPISVENSPQGNEDIDVSVNHLLQVARICRFPIRIRGASHSSNEIVELLDQGGPNADQSLRRGISNLPRLVSTLHRPKPYGNRVVAVIRVSKLKLRR